MPGKKNSVNTIPEVPGTYMLSHSSGVYYIGSTENLRRREAHHRSDLRNGKHRSKLLQSMFNEDPNVRFGIMDLNPDREVGYQIEQEALNSLSGDPLLANSATDVKASGLGRTVGEETRQKMSAAKKGVTPSDKWRLSVSAAHQKRLSDENYVPPENSRRVRINGVDYRSISSASKALGVSKSTIVHRNEIPRE